MKKCSLYTLIFFTVLLLLPMLPAKGDIFAKFSKYAVIRILSDPSYSTHSPERFRFGRECGRLIEAWDDDDPEPLASSEGFTFHVSPQHAERVKSSLRRNAIPFKIISHDMGHMIRQQITGSANNDANDRSGLGGQANQLLMTSVLPRDRTSSDFFTSYHPLREIYSYLRKVNASHSNADLKVIGKTYEGREILAMEIKSRKSSDRGISDALMLECGIHAREWISPASCLWIIDRLLNQTMHEHDDSLLFPSFGGSFIVIPVTNPDGYEYTWSEERLWRKNRSPNRFFQRCHGIDLNRNFGVAFKGGSEIFDSCGHTYAGTTAFSELETQALRNYTYSLIERKVNIKGYLSVHSFSQLLMFPYGYSKKKPANDEELYKIAKLAVEEMGRPNGTVYRFGRIIETIYGKATHGNSVDYMYDKMGAKYSFAIELRDQGDEGFLLHPRFIKPTANELWLAVKTIASFFSNAHGN